MYPTQQRYRRHFADAALVTTPVFKKLQALAQRLRQFANEAQYLSRPEILTEWRALKQEVTSALATLQSMDLELVPQVYDILIEELPEYMQEADVAARQQGKDFGHAFSQVGFMLEHILWKLQKFNPSETLPVIPESELEESEIDRIDINAEFEEDNFVSDVSLDRAINGFMKRAQRILQTLGYSGVKFSSESEYGSVFVSTFITVKSGADGNALVDQLEDELIPLGRQFGAQEVEIAFEW